MALAACCTHGSYGPQARNLEKAKDKAGGVSQLKTNQASMSIVCQVCRQTFMVSMAWFPITLRHLPVPRGTRAPRTHRISRLFAEDSVGGPAQGPLGEQARQIAFGSGAPLPGRSATASAAHQPLHDTNCSLTPRSASLSLPRRR